MKNLLVIIVCSFLVISCVATHNGVMSSSSLEKPVKYIDMAYGVAQTNKFFGIGGIGKDALIFEAKRNLIKNRPLSQNEQYINFTTDFKRTYFPFYSQTKVSLSADVVAFQNDKSSEIYSDKYKMKLMNNQYNINLFCIGDTIIDKKENEGVIISIKNSKQVRILFETNNGNIRTKFMSLSKIYTKEKGYRGLKVGQRFIYTLYNKSLNNSQSKQTSGEIIALGINDLLVRDNDGSLKTMIYNH